MPSGQLSLQDLLVLSDEELARYDVAAVNLACAAGLPGAEQIEVAACLRTIDAWAERVFRETERLSDRFRQRPAAFGHSLAYFRALIFVTVLQRDLGVWTDPKLNETNNFSDARDLFIHGILQGCGGTCSSLPVLYAAIGRRLGYPLRLASTAMHLFVRWDDPGTARFNIECTAPGLFTPPDWYYLTWPMPITPDEFKGTCWLKSQTPREELAGFLIQRGYCFVDNGRYREGVEACAWSHTLAPHDRLHLGSLRRLLVRWEHDLRQKCPPNFPRLTITFPPRRFPQLPLEVERRMVHLGVMDALLNDRQRERDWWGPLRHSPGCRPSHLPSQLAVECI
jgi:hypothetical protein